MGFGEPPVSQIAPAAVHWVPQVLQFAGSVAALTQAPPQ
jgi:hypothetical protein